jgi:hypothetical protein
LATSIAEVSPALQNLDLVLHAEPDDIDCLVMRGRVRVILGRIDDGISDLERVIKIRILGTFQTRNRSLVGRDISSWVLAVQYGSRTRKR